MKHNSARSSVLALAALALTFTATAWAQYNENVLFTPYHSNGSYLYSLVADAAGNLYGASSEGGNPGCPPLGCGLIFKLSNSGGTWTETILHSFTGADGYTPIRIVLDAQGNIYGAADFGGPKGSGVIFKLSKSANGLWKFLILHSFPDDPDDGIFPDGVGLDAVGNLYGLANGGANTDCSGNGCGAVFELSPTASGPWKETILHRFVGTPNDGAFPYGPMLFDRSGNLYGTAGSGGPFCSYSSIGCGIVFQLTPTSSGTWIESVLHAFNGTDGYDPSALHMDSSGNLFGVGVFGGIRTTLCNYGCGTIFELSPSSSGWTESTVYNFTFSGDGLNPTDILPDNAGNLFGSATFAEIGVEGSVYELSPNSSGGWTETTLFLFSNPVGGGDPTSILMDASGNIFGTTYTGGDVNHYSSGDGVVFELSPSTASK